MRATKRLSFKIRIVMFSAVTDLSSCCSIGDDLGVDFDICSSSGVNLDTFSGLATVKLKQKQHISTALPYFFVLVLTSFYKKNAQCFTANYFVANCLTQ